jgi:hypothetical protein
MLSDLHNLRRHNNLSLPQAVRSASGYGVLLSFLRQGPRAIAPRIPATQARAACSNRRVSYQRASSTRFQSPSLS